MTNLARNLAASAARAGDARPRVAAVPGLFTPALRGQPELAGGTRPDEPVQRPDGMVWIPGGQFTMGSDRHYPEEAPAHLVSVGGFWIDPHPVTNAQFGVFVEATGYRTVAERPADPSVYPGADPAMLAPGSAVFTPPSQPVDLQDPYLWWSYVPGAFWRHPGGPGTSARDLPGHPVTHVAWPDTLAYATWAGKQIPAEAEWEYAARGGLPDSVFAWGDELTPGGRHMANTWQGEFPHQNLRLDGCAGTSPAGAFPANGYGLHDMIGNVWEWTSDWYAAHPSRAAGAPACCGTPSPPVSPACGPEAGSAGPDPLDERIPRKVTKGGSYLCAPNYCRRYRPAARMAQPIDTSTCHLGFRCIVRPPRELNKADDFRVIVRPSARSTRSAAAGDAASARRVRSRQASPAPRFSGAC